MNKNILKSIYKNVVAKDEMRPVMNGIFFEEGSCVGSDGHLLVVYKCGKTKMEGQIIGPNGEFIDGRYPNYKSVIPSEREEYPYRIDLKDVYNACSWHLRQSYANAEDCVLILQKGFGIKTLVRLLSVFIAADEIKTAKIFKSDADRATVIESESVTAVIMPKLINNVADIDNKLDEDSATFYSYEKIMNEYAFNSWKKPESNDWMDNI